MQRCKKKEKASLCKIGVAWQLSTRPRYKHRYENKRLKSYKDAVYAPFNPLAT